MNCTRFLAVWLAFASLCLALLGACQPVLANRGNLVDPDRLSEIKPGETDRATVQKVLGPPTTVGTFDNKLWYYSGKRTERTAFWDPETIDQRTVIVVFNDSDIVDKVTEVDPNQQLAIAPEDRRTPTVGESITVMDQLRDSLSHPGLPNTVGSGRGPGQTGPGR